MVEFGAGGNIVQPTQTDDAAATETEPAADGTPATNGNSAGASAGTTTPGAPATGTSPISPVNPRRKRKAKGWFCPVCRQRKPSVLNLKPKTLSLP
jgi:hypothetical protein